MIATEIPAAMRPYSIAVAADSSFKKRMNRFFIGQSKAVPFRGVGHGGELLAADPRDPLFETLAARSCAWVNIIEKTEVVIRC